jgi:hypothetical protein
MLNAIGADLNIEIHVIPNDLKMSAKTDAIGSLGSLLRT